MILVIDIGNTHIHLGRFEARSLQRELRFTTRVPLTPDEAWWMVREVEPSGLEGAIIASVVPGLVGPFSEMLKNRCGVKPVLVSHKLSTGLKFGYLDPGSLGADRIANAVGAHTEYERDTVIIDFGTATTFDLVTREGEYRGGVIIPGVRLSLDALVREAAQLFPVELRVPERCIGRSTREAIQSGIFYAVQGQVARILALIRAETGLDLFVIATGGMAQQLAPHIPEIHLVDPLLTLKGMLELYYRNLDAGR